MPISLSYSRIRDYMQCPMKYKKRYIEHITVKEKPKPLSLGSCMADALSTFRKTGDGDEAMQSFLSKWKEEGCVLEARKEEDPLRSVERGLEILADYMNTFPDDPKITKRPEIWFEIYIKDLDVAFRGRLDAVALLDKNKPAIMEDKTTTRMGPTYFPQIQGSYQILWYLFFADKLGLFNVDPEKKLNPYALITGIYVHKNNFASKREPVFKSRMTLQKAYEDMRCWIKQIKWAIENDHFPRGDSEVCNKFGGCEYLPLRNVTPEMEERIIKSEYEQRPPEEPKVDEMITI